jgi:hypothetical protein
VPAVNGGAATNRPVRRRAAAEQFFTEGTADELGSVSCVFVCVCVFMTSLCKGGHGLTRAPSSRDPRRSLSFCSRERGVWHVASAPLGRRCYRSRWLGAAQWSGKLPLANHCGSTVSYSNPSPHTRVASHLVFCTGNCAGLPG